MNMQHEINKLGEFGQNVAAFLRAEVKRVSKCKTASAVAHAQLMVTSPYKQYLTPWNESFCQ
jgi:hypothetical protein